MLGHIQVTCLQNCVVFSALSNLSLLLWGDNKGSVSSSWLNVLLPAVHAMKGPSPQYIDFYRNILQRDEQNYLDFALVVLAVTSGPLVCRLGYIFW